jgi:hypothetical protein
MIHFKSTEANGNTMDTAKPGLDLNSLELLDQEDLLKLVKGMMSGGVALSFYGKRTATEISKRVRPRVTRRLPDLARQKNSLGT